ncbi:transposase family protein [Streptomyces triculaminicus]|uniref:transposase family protein n=1 Tax=Streptomyces triculaminicus TaxID=2816232 RepID=UPI0037991802
MFTGLRPRQFQRLVRAVHREGGRALVPDRPGCLWVLTREDRVLLVAMHCRTNLTMRQLALQFGISLAAAGRIISWYSPCCPWHRANASPGDTRPSSRDPAGLPSQEQRSLLGHQRRRPHARPGLRPGPDHSTTSQS